MNAPAAMPSASPANLYANILRRSSLDDHCSASTCLAGDGRGEAQAEHEHPREERRRFVGQDQ